MVDALCYHVCNQSLTVCGGLWLVTTQLLWLSSWNETGLSKFEALKVHIIIIDAYLLGSYVYLVQNFHVPCARTTHSNSHLWRLGIKISPNIKLSRDSKVVDILYIYIYIYMIKYCSSRIWTSYLCGYISWTSSIYQ